MAYALVASGLALIFGIMNVINFAHGDFYMIGAYGVVLAMSALGADYFTASILSIVAVAVIGLAMQRIVIEPLTRFNPLSILLATFAISLLIRYSIIISLGSAGKLIATPFHGVVEIGGVVIAGQKIFIFVVGAIVFAALGYMMTRTPLGKLMRAAAQNRGAAMVLGVNVRAVERVAFGMGIALAALGGTLVGPLTPAVPEMGAVLTLKAFAVIVVGGMGTIWSAVVVGILLGIIETLASGYFSSAWRDVIAYSILLLCLLTRPTGLFGARTA
jgi:branched-chain amino acid transport system permease protein